MVRASSGASCCPATRPTARRPRRSCARTTPSGSCSGSRTSPGSTATSTIEHEADDLIAAWWGSVTHPGSEIVIASGDKDLLQLLGPNPFGVRTLAHRFGDPELWTAERFEAGQRLPPGAVAAGRPRSMGDASDNIEGRPGHRAEEGREDAAGSTAGTSCEADQGPLPRGTQARVEDELPPDGPPEPAGGPLGESARPASTRRRYGTESGALLDDLPDPPGAGGDPGAVSPPRPLDQADGHAGPLPAPARGGREGPDPAYQAWGRDPNVCPQGGHQEDRVPSTPTDTPRREAPAQAPPR
jgi:hypothetical protein